MGKANKANQRSKRLIAKRARKTANRAHWESLRRTGENTKSKRFVAKSKKNKRAKTIDHKDGPCGNIACKKCDPGKIHRR